MNDAYLVHAVRSSLVDVSYVHLAASNFLALQMLDKTLLVVLRDGRKFMGTLR